MEFCHLPAKADMALRIDGSDVCKEGSDPEGRLVQDEGFFPAHQFLDPGASAAGFGRGESVKKEGSSTDACGTDESGKGRGAGDGDNLVTCGPGSAGRAGTWVRDSGGSGIGAVGDRFAGAQEFKDSGDSPFFVIGMAGDEGFPDFKVGEEFEGVAGVLAGDGIHSLEGFKGAQGHVAKVADRCCNEVEGGHGFRVGGRDAQGQACTRRYPGKGNLFGDGLTFENLHCILPRDDSGSMTAPFGEGSAGTGSGGFSWTVHLSGGRSS